MTENSTVAHNCHGKRNNLAAKEKLTAKGAVAHKCHGRNKNYNKTKRTNKDNRNSRQNSTNSRQDNANSRQHNTRQHNGNFSRRKWIATAEVKCRGGCNLITILLQATICFCALWRNCGSWTGRWVPGVARRRRRKPHPLFFLRGLRVGGDPFVFTEKPRHPNERKYLKTANWKLWFENKTTGLQHRWCEGICPNYYRRPWMFTWIQVSMARTEAERN